jgi:hypothetical protein
MNVGEIITRAFNEFYRDPGTASSALTPDMACHWIDTALRNYWKLFQDNEYGYYRFSEKILPVTTATNIYSLPNGNPDADDTDNVAFVTVMALRQGSSPNFQYATIPTILPTNKYGGVYPSILTAIWQYTQNGGGGIAWSEESGAQDVDGYPTRKIRFTPWPRQNFTAVYDGVRYPNPIWDGETVDTEAIPDIPIHFHDGIVLHILRDAYLSLKADTTELDLKIAAFDAAAMKPEQRGVQRQGPEGIQNVLGW